MASIKKVLGPILALTLILLASASWIAPAGARTYENSWIVYTGFYFSKTIYGR